MLFGCFQKNQFSNFVNNLKILFDVKGAKMLKIKTLRHEQLARKLQTRLKFIEFFDKMPVELSKTTTLFSSNFSTFFEKFQKNEDQQNREFFTIWFRISDWRDFNFFIQKITKQYFGEVEMIKHSSNSFEGLADSFIFFSKINLNNITCNIGCHIIYCWNITFFNPFTHPFIKHLQIYL